MTAYPVREEHADHVDDDLSKEGVLWISFFLHKNISFCVNIINAMPWLDDDVPYEVSVRAHFRACGTMISVASLLLKKLNYLLHEYFFIE